MEALADGEAMGVVDEATVAGLTVGLAAPPQAATETPNRPPAMSVSKGWRDNGDEVRLEVGRRWRPVMAWLVMAPMVAR